MQKPKQVVRRLIALYQIITPSKCIITELTHPLITFSATISVFYWRDLIRMRKTLVDTSWFSCGSHDWLYWDPAARPSQELSQNCLCTNIKLHAEIYAEDESDGTREKWRLSIVCFSQTELLAKHRLYISNFHRMIGRKSSASKQHPKGSGTLGSSIELNHIYSYSIYSSKASKSINELHRSIYSREKVKHST